jgi:hypothetical protein
MCEAKRCVLRERGLALASATTLDSELTLLTLHNTAHQRRLQTVTCAASKMQHVTIVCSIHRRAHMQANQQTLLWELQPKSRVRACVCACVHRCHVKDGRLAQREQGKKMTIHDFVACPSAAGRASWTTHRCAPAVLTPVHGMRLFSMCHTPRGWPSTWLRRAQHAPTHATHTCHHIAHQTPTTPTSVS